MRVLRWRNLGLKFLSLLFAFSLWLFVNLKASEEKDLKLPVRWENMPDFLEITNPVNDFVRVRVIGPRRILSSLDPSRFPVILDLSDAKEGLLNYQISDKMIHSLPGLRATVLLPDTIQFKFELVVKKQIPVKVRTVGALPEGYALEGVRCKPDVIEVVGAQSEVQSLQEVETAPVDLSNLRGDSLQKVKVVLNRPHVWPATDMDRVEVELAIGEARLQKVLTQVPVQVRNASGPVALRPDQVEVVLDGTARKVRAVGAGKVDAWVTIPGEKARSYRLPVEVRVGVEGVTGRADPEQIEATVKSSKRTR